MLQYDCAVSVGSLAEALRAIAEAKTRGNQKFTEPHSSSSMTATGPVKQSNKGARIVI
jgi:hypothetical protein